MASVSSVTINMPAATVEALLAGNFSLYAFKAVEAFPSGGSPLVWQATQEIMQVVEIQWSDEIEAYTSQSSIQINNQITPGFTVPDASPFVFASVTSGDVEIFFNDAEAAMKEYSAFAARPKPVVLAHGPTSCTTRPSRFIRCAGSSADSVLPNPIASRVSPRAACFVRPSTSGASR